MAAPDPADLLPQNALAGVSVGLSVSESTDLTQLGLVEDHFRMALAEIARTVLVSGGDIFYGGHLRPDGYTIYLLEELQKYGRRDRPLKVCLSLTEHLCMSAEEIDAQKENVGLFGELRFIDEKGRLLDASLNEKRDHGVFTDEENAAALTGLRHYLIEQTNARILLGGKREGFQGAMPGLVEEALLSIKMGKPLYLAGGFGGVTLDLIECVNPHYVEWFPMRATEPDPKLYEGLSKVRAAIERTGWTLDCNGLDEQENALLSATYRPSEIAALVGLGLGRINPTSIST